MNGRPVALANASSRLDFFTHDSHRQLDRCERLGNISRVLPPSHSCPGGGRQYTSASRHSCYLPCVNSRESPEGKGKEEQGAASCQHDSSHHIVLELEHCSSLELDHGKSKLRAHSSSSGKIAPVSIPAKVSIGSIYNNYLRFPCNTETQPLPLLCAQEQMQSLHFQCRCVSFGSQHLMLHR